MTPALQINLHQIANSAFKGLRWQVVRLLYATRPDFIHENILAAALRSEWRDVSISHLRREVDYLQMAGLLLIKPDGQSWLLKLTHQGVDLVEYTTPCPPGIGRPELS